MKGPIELYIYSAHYDDRQSLYSDPYIRVIGLSQLKQEDTFYCIAIYSNQSTHAIQATMHPIGAGVWRHGKYFTEFVLGCPLPNTDVPTHVSITLDPKLEATFATPVEVAEKSKKRDEVGVCTAVSFGNLKPARIIEWIEFNRLMGVGGITIYNNCLSAEAQRIFKYYAKTEPDFLYLRNTWMFMKDEGDLAFFMQYSPIITDCLYRYRLRYKSMLVIDLDEMVVPHSSLNYTTMLSTIKQSNDLTNDNSLTHRYTFRNTYFFFDFAPIPTQPQELVTLRFMRRAEHSGVGYSAKSLVGADSCIGMHNHYCWHHTPAVERSNKKNILEVILDFCSYSNYLYL